MTQPQAAQHFADPVAASEYAAYKRAQLEEHGQWEATETILVGSVPGWAAGHSVPASTVAANPWMVERGLVKRVAPPPQPGVDRGEQLRQRQAALAQEQAAIAAELEEAEAADSTSPYRDLTVAQLQEMLRNRQLSTAGKKADLLARLAEYDQAAASESDEPIEE